MYRVYCDDKLLHDTHIEELKLINPKLDLEVNKTGSFTFTIYPSHPYFGMLKKLKSEIKVFQNEELIFRGRILDDAEGFKNERQVTCEGELAFLLDSSQRPYEFKGDIPELFTRFIDAHNTQVEEKKRFKVGKITVKDKNGYISRSDTQYLSTYDSIFKKLINTHGGYLNIRHELDGVYIDYLEDFTKQNAQDIELRKNILGLNMKTKGSEIATAIIPLGAKIKVEQPEETTEAGPIEGNQQVEERRLTIESVNGGKDYVYNAEAVERFGWIYKVVTWDDVTLPENLLRKANEELATAFLYEKSIEISAVDLSGTNKNIAAFRIGTYNKVVTDIHGLNEFLLVKKLSLNLTNPKGDKLTLGKTYQSLTEQDKDNGDKLGNIIDRVETIIGDYEVNKPMIEQVLNKLTLTIERNHPLNQNYNPNTDVYVPDYTAQPLVLTPKAKYRAKEVECTFIWKRIVNGKELELENGEVQASKGILTISKNFGTEQKVYKCYATYKSGTSNYVANEIVEFNKIDAGSNGETGAPGKDAAIQSPTEPADKTQLWLDTSVTPPLLKQWNGEEWVIVNDSSEEIISLREELKSEIKQESTGIRTEVAQNFYTKDEASQLQSSVSTQLEQTKKDFTFKFNEYNRELNELEGNMNSEFQTISEYIRFFNGNIEMGAVGNEFKQLLTRMKNSFMQNGVEIAYFGNRKMYVTDGEFTNSCQVGNFGFIPEDNGSLSFRKVR